MKPGDDLTPFTAVADPGRMKTMALLLRDPNPIHWDPVTTARLGLGDRVINQGPINMSYLLELAIRAAGGPEHVRRFAARFTGNVLAGEAVVCTGRVLRTGDGTADLELEARVDDRVVCTGSATVAHTPDS